MYAAVPSSMPALVSVAGLHTSGCDLRHLLIPEPSIPDPCWSALARPKSSTFTVAIGAQLDVGGLEIAMHDPALVRGIERVGDLGGDGRARRRSGMRAAGESFGKILAFDQLHDQRRCGTGAVLEAVDGGDVRMVERGKGVRLAREAGEPLRIAARRTRAGS